MKTALCRISLCILLCVPIQGISQENPFRTRGTPPPDVLTKGREATLELPTGRVNGELLSVSKDSLWIQSTDGTRAVALLDVESADIQVHQWGAGRMLTWNLIAGLGSALALSVACNSVEGTEECGDVFLTWSAIWGVIGGISGALIARSSRREVDVSLMNLRPYARYPQGLPPGNHPSRSRDPGSGGGG